MEIKLNDSGTLAFVVSGPPQGKQRPRFAAGRVYDAGNKDYEELVGVMFLSAVAKKGGAWDKPAAVNVCITAYYPIPRSWSKKKQELAAEGALHPKKPDIDNVVKIVLDGLNGLAWKDDADVVSIFARKQYSKFPRVLVEVTALV